MKIAVASGKGGTGKTLISTSLAIAASEYAGTRVTFLDCDVEEPNAHLLLSPEIVTREDVRVPLPLFTRERCTGCGLCAGVCEYHAIMVNRKTKEVYVFDKMCHGCGACVLLCPEAALREGKRVIGSVEGGRAGDISFWRGVLNVGEPMAPPVIREVKKKGAGIKDVIMDCPPGTSCPVVTSVIGSDFCLLVTEPTPFGLNDLRLAVEMARAIGVRTAVVINQADIGDSGVRDYCKGEGLKILSEIPHDRKIAEGYSRGMPAIRIGEQYKEVFVDLWAAIGNEQKANK